MANKKVLVTGCCGSVGKELVVQLLKEPSHSIGELVGLDNDEGQLFFLDQEFMADTRASFFMADLRDLATLTQLMQGVDIVFHAAALKHVVLCERSPMEAVQTNIHGVQNVIAAARANNVGRVIFTSSDKAVNPTSVMGTSKLMGERLITAANSNSRDGVTIFSSTRFGNVLGSSGSVIPIFANQIKAGGPITITDKAMTRFIMTVQEAAALVIESAKLAKGGEVLITKMPVINIFDLANSMIELLAPVYGIEPSSIDLKYVGTKPGEKLYEELMSEEETRRTLELKDYFAVLPAYRGIYRKIEYKYPHQVSNTVDNPYNSAIEKKLTVESLIKYLVKHDLLNIEQLLGRNNAERYWPGDKEEKVLLSVNKVGGVD